jgi:beta-lactamase regulating signal transducer with metallopeptidase domain
MNSMLPSIVTMLLKWTLLLALGWGAQWLLWERDSRWRRILWRSILCLGLILPLMQFVPLPVLQIPIYHASVSPTQVADLPPTAAVGSPVSKSSAAFHPPAEVAKASAVASGSSHAASGTGPGAVHWETWLLFIWVVGAAFAGFRLVGFQVQLGRLRQASHPASPAIQQWVGEIRARLGVRRRIGIRVSGSVCSPFACGLWRPMILLPEKLVQDIPADEISVLLAHEVAHFRGHDLPWCVGWRWVQALFWFHPLVWKIPAAHNLACEQEADRIASGGLADHHFYPQLLARLALRVLSVPQVEIQLVLNGASQIALRLSYLKQGKAGIWKPKHSVAGFGLAGVLFLLATGCEFSKSSPAQVKPASAVEFKKVMVLVQDEEGKPIAGASIKPDGFRVKGIHGADGYHWGDAASFGPPEKVTTGPDGKALLKYPVMGIPEEKELTGALIFSVYHPEYSTERIQDFSVDGTNNPIQLRRGIALEFSAYFGADRQPVTELVPNLSEEGVRPEDWQKKENGVMAFHKLSPGGHLLQLMGRLPSGGIVYSETVAFTAEKGKPCEFALEMKPGVRLEGRLDDRVSRPVRNGRVMIDVRPKEYPALTVLDDFYDLDKKYGGRYFWHSYRPINEDGTFVFESIPPGEVDVVVLGDGFAAKSSAQLVYRDKSTSPMPVPQAFPLVSPVTKVEVATEPTATLEFSATTKSGKPIEGARVGMYPSVFRMRGIYGWVKKSSEEPFRVAPELAEPIFAGKTGKDGKLVLRNIPGQSRGLEVEHPNFQTPLQEPGGWRDRHIRTKFSSGVTNKFALTMEPTGTDFIGGSE